MLVVARYLDGRIVKGLTTDFHPGSDSFHINDGSEVPPERVTTDRLKAVYFVRSLEGNTEYRDHREFPETRAVRTKLWLEFDDGERMAAWPVSAALGRRGFYVLPTDIDSNLERVYVFRKGLTQLLHGKEAEKASKREARRYQTRTLSRLVGQV